MDGKLLRRWVLPAASGVLLAVAFPPFDVNQAAWVALIPLLVALENCPPGEAFRRGYIAGLTFFGLTVWWVVHVSWAAPVALVAALALYWGGSGWWFARWQQWRAGRDAVWCNLVVLVLGTAGWAVLEWVRGKFLLGGFGWNTLGASQYRAVPLLQIAAVTGVYGVSALVCAVNWALYFTGRRLAGQLRRSEPLRRPSWEFYVAMLLVAGTFLHGVRTIRRQMPTHSIRLALVQANIPQSLKFEPEQRAMILERHDRLTRIATSDGADMILWPETAVPGALRFDPESYALATSHAAQARAPLLTGTFDFEPFSDPPIGYNAAVLVEPDGRVSQLYRKIHLVPFGEYVPWRKVLPFMKWFTPISDSFERGRDFAVFTAAGMRFGVVICFEDTVPHLYRHFVQQGVDFMVNLTNDAWFKESPAAALHLANAAVRAAETRRPLVRVTNNGVTCVTDEFGFITHRLEPFAERAARWEVEIPQGDAATFYTERGDVFAAGCGLLTALGLLGLLLQRRNVRQPVA